MDRRTFIKALAGGGAAALAAMGLRVDLARPGEVEEASRAVGVAKAAKSPRGEYLAAWREYLAHRGAEKRALDSLLSVEDMSVSRYGEKRALEVVLEALGHHNKASMAIAGTVGVHTTERVVNGGGLALRRYGVSAQWTEAFFENATPHDLGKLLHAVAQADYNVIGRWFREVLNPREYVYKDSLVDDAPIKVKCLRPGRYKRADAGRFGKDEDYATRALDAMLTRAWTRSGAELALMVPYTLTGRLKHLDPFAPYPLEEKAELEPMGWRPVGEWRGEHTAQVWRMPFTPMDHMFAYDLAAPRPLGLRTRLENSGDLRMVYEDADSPLRCTLFDREMGGGVVERGNGSVLQLGRGEVYAWDKQFR